MGYKITFLFQNMKICRPFRVSRWGLSVLIGLTPYPGLYRPVGQHNPYPHPAGATHVMEQRIRPEDAGLFPMNNILFQHAQQRIVNTLPAGA